MVKGVERYPLFSVFSRRDEPLHEHIVDGLLPVLALRGLTVFPDQTVHFDVGRVKSALALEDAMKKDPKIFLATCTPLEPLPR